MILFVVPGITMARFFATPSSPARATSGASCHMNPGTSLAGAFGALLELGVREAGAQRGDRHTGALQLLVHGFGERRHEGLRRAVRGVRRTGLETCERRHVEDATAAALDHRGRGRVGQPDECDDVQLDGAGLGVDVERVERTERAEAGVVDEQVDRAYPFLDCGKLIAYRSGRRAGPRHGHRPPSRFPWRARRGERGRARRARRRSRAPTAGARTAPRSRRRHP